MGLSVIGASKVPTYYNNDLGEGGKKKRIKNLEKTYARRIGGVEGEKKQEPEVCAKKGNAKTKNLLPWGKKKKKGLRKKRKGLTPLQGGGPSPPKGKTGRSILLNHYARGGRL